MAYNLWDSIFTGNDTRIRKALYGSFLIRDWNGSATSLSSYSPFDATTGNLSTTLLTTDGWVDPGMISENGVQFNPKYTTNETMVWQSRVAARTDVTQDEEECTVSFMEGTPTIDELNYQLPLGSLPSLGSSGYSVAKPNVPQMQYRQVLALGVDGSTGNNEYFAILFGRCLVTKVEKFDFSAKDAIQASLTFSAYPDPYSGFAVKRFREGPAWRAAGGTTATPGTVTATAVAGDKAHLAFAAPSSNNGPFTYTVYERTPAGTGTATQLGVGDVTVVSTTGGNVTLEVAGLTTGSDYDFAVTATGSNGSTSTMTAYSTPSITAIA